MTEDKKNDLWRLISDWGRANPKNFSATSNAAKAIESFIELEVEKAAKLEGFDAAMEQHTESGGACVTDKYETREDYENSLK